MNSKNIFNSLCSLCVGKKNAAHSNVKPGFLRQKLRISGAISISCLLVFGLAVSSNLNVYSAEDVKGQVKQKTEKTEKDKEKEAEKKDDKAGEKKEAVKAPEPPIENVVSVQAEDLVEKPHEYLGKNVKFTAPFFAFSNLALDYKPAYRSSKTHISLLVSRSKKKLPLSELKLAMMTPKEKDPETTLLANLKEGDTLEITGKVFSTALDDPWVEILRLKKIGGSTDDKKADATVKAKTNDTKSSESKSDKPNGGKSDSQTKTPTKN